MAPTWSLFYLLILGLCSICCKTTFHTTFLRNFHFSTETRFKKVQRKIKCSFTDQPSIVLLETIRSELFRSSLNTSWNTRTTMFQVSCSSRISHRSLRKVLTSRLCWTPRSSTMNLTTMIGHQLTTTNLNSLDHTMKTFSSWESTTKLCSLKTNSNQSMNKTSWKMKKYLTAEVVWCRASDQVRKREQAKFTKSSTLWTCFHLLVLILTRTEIFTLMTILCNLPTTISTCLIHVLILRSLPSLKQTPFKTWLSSNGTNMDTSSIF